MQAIKRDICTITKTNDLESLYTFNNFPVFMGCVEQPEHMDLKCDMSWSISRSSGLIQLDKLIPLDILYSKSHGAGAIGKLWENHHQQFADFINRFKPSSVFEIGGAHGTLEKKYQKHEKISWTILEPNPSPIDGCEAKFIRGIFTEDFVYEAEFDTIVHSHVFEHIYNLNDFVRQLSTFMDLGKRLIFSVPNMRVMLNRKYTNCLNFEHTIFLTEEYIQYLLSLYGFRITAKEYFMEDHSIFFSAVRDENVETIPLNSNLYEINKNLFMDYVNHYKNLINHLNEIIDKTDKPLFLFGAHIFTQYLIEMGLNTKRIVHLLDNDPNKQGKRLYGTSLIVASPKILSNVDNPIVILKAGAYSDEIKMDITKNINGSTEFI